MFAFERVLPESEGDIRHDSRWPAFFPSAMGFVSTGDGTSTALEKVVGAAIVNRFPYVMAVSFCREDLSERHYARQRFTAMLESSGHAAIQFLAPPGLDQVLAACISPPEQMSETRVEHTGLGTRPGMTHCAPVFEDAYLVYEGHLARPARDFSGDSIYSSPWVDVGSHRVYFLEIRAIQLRKDIAEGASQIRWQSLPDWRAEASKPRGHEGKPGRDEGTKGRRAGQFVLDSKPTLRVAERSSGGEAAPGVKDNPQSAIGYVKPYTPHYSFPSPNTVAFAHDFVDCGMAVKLLAPHVTDQVERDNERARWPCFFPSSVGMITSWTKDGIPNLMPCGSTSVVSRRPFVIAPCVSYAAINDRYAPHATLDSIRTTGCFGCGVPFVDDAVVRAIQYAGNVTIGHDPEKIRHAGLECVADEVAPILPALPIHFDCRVIGEVRLGTHIMFLGEVGRILVRSDVRPENPLHWRPWPTLAIAAEPRCVELVGAAG